MNLDQNDAAAQPRRSLGMVERQPRVAVDLMKARQEDPQRFCADLPGLLSNQVRQLTLAFGPDVVRSPACFEYLARDARLDELASSAVADMGLKPFLDKLIALRLDGRQAKPSVTAVLPAISDVRFALLRVAFSATRAYATAWSEQLSPVHDWSTHAVKVEVDDPWLLHDQLVEAAQLVQDVAAQVPVQAVGDSGGARPLRFLGARTLASRLKGLADDLESARRQGRGVSLRGTTVEWLTDVLWHSLLLDSPSYRRVDELALQVSLMGSRHARPFRRLEPSASVQRDAHEGLVSLTEAVRESISAGYHPRPLHELRGNLHGAAADLLFAAHQAYRRDEDLPFPIVVTSGFDVELEQALWAADVPGGKYVVAFPVFVRPHRPRARLREGVEGEGRQVPSRYGMLRWVAGTFACTAGDLPRDHQLGEDDRDEVLAALLNPVPATGERIGPRFAGWQWLDDLLPSSGHRIELPGPLLLKVNGSPMHEVASVRQQGGLRREKQASVIQATVLGEFDVLQVTHVDVWSYATRHDGGTGHSSGSDPGSGPEQGLPQALAAQFSHEDRYWVLVGQHLEEWNSRLQLFLQVSRAFAGGEDDAGIPVAAVSPSFDEDRVGLLEGLGVTQVAMQPESLTDPIRQAAAALRRDGT